MKKTLCVLLALGMIFLCSGFAVAGNNQSDQEGMITLTDSGAGPGIQEVPVSRRSVVAYTGAGNAAAYGGTAGQVMCCIAGHPDANPDDALYFGVRGSQESDQATYPDDNRVYQISAGGTACTVAQCVTYSTTDITGWHERGGGST